MGSLNPVVLLPRALKRRGGAIAGDLAASVTVGCGQFCTKPGLLIAMEGEELDVFIGELSGCIRKILPVSMLNPKIHAGFLATRQNALDQGGVRRVVVSDVDPDAAAHQGQPSLATVAAADFIANPILQDEVFGPYTLLVRCDDRAHLAHVVQALAGQLTATVMAEEDELDEYLPMVDLLQEKSGRIIYNGIPTGVEVCAAMHHGGPYPASSDARFTSVGTAAIKRFVRPVSFQNWPQSRLPDALKEGNPLTIWRLVDNARTKN
jgi:alpha-ketoglutaric semialdehyde dehydrogenase